MYIDFSEWAKNVKLFVYLVNAHKGWPQQTRILIKWIGWSVLRRPVSLFAQSLLSSPNNLMNKLDMVAEMEVTDELSNIDFHSPKPSWVWPWLSARWGTIPRGDLLATWWQVGYTGPLPSWKGQYFVLTRIDTYSGYRFSLPVMLWPQLASMDLTECFIHCHGIPHSIDFDQGTHFTPKKCNNGSMLMEFTEFTIFPTILKQLVW